jgi:AcrR family transcriptional regulator
MAPEERRRAIVDVVVPLLLEHGEDVSTRQIAEAAGIAEGTIFRVFPDKPALLLAAAEQVMNPPDGAEQLHQALAGAETLHERVLIAARRMVERSELVMVVMMALRRLAMSGSLDHRHRPAGPPAFLAEAQQTLHAMLVDVFTPHRAELGVDPDTAALLLRTLVLGSRHPGAVHSQRLTPEQITDALLDGIRDRSRHDEAPDKAQGD